MSSQAATLPYTSDVNRHASPITVSRMMPDDISAVIDIERASFPRPWPEKAYRYELVENPNAYFVVARAARPERPITISPLQKLFSRIRPITNPTGTSRYQLPAREIIGFAGMWMYVDEAHIATIATRADWRGRGVGKAILHSLMREAQRRNAISVTLEVRIGNAVAQNLYRAYGFEEVGRRKGYYQDNREDALLMTVTNFATAAYRARLDALERHLYHSADAIN